MTNEEMNDPFNTTNDPFTEDQDTRSRHIKHSNKHSDFKMKWMQEHTDADLNREFNDDVFECSFRNPAEWQINHKGDREEF
jgi:hypothetical protein